MPAERPMLTRNTSNRETFAGRKVHLIGIGGSGMRALAQMLLDSKALVSGSDQYARGTIEKLAQAGAKIATGQRDENLPERCDLVVYSAAIHEQNPELLAAQKAGCEVLKYSQMLGRLMAQRVGVAVAGTHGKSTTTAMVAYVLRQAGVDPSFIVGATVDQLGGPSGVGNGPLFLAEACEYDRSFLNLHPQIAAVLNIEEDHLDCYENLTAIVEAFKAFVCQIQPEGLLVLNGEDRHTEVLRQAAVCQVETFSLANGADWSADNVTSQHGRYAMDVRYGGRLFCRLNVPLAGRHNAANALAAVALLYHAGLEGAHIAELLAGFTGTHRRMMHKAQNCGIIVLDDYAHHPTEIQVTLRAIREAYQPQRIVCVFQPHQHSRTRFLLRDFARSFGCATEVLVPDIYFVRDSALEKDYISSRDLVAQIRLNGAAALYLPSFDRIVRHLQRTLTEGDLLVTMGAGNVWEIADEIVRWLGTDR